MTLRIPLLFHSYILLIFWGNRILLTSDSVARVYTSVGQLLRKQGVSHAVAMPDLAFENCFKIPKCEEFSFLKTN